MGSAVTQNNLQAHHPLKTMPDLKKGGEQSSTLQPSAKSSFFSWNYWNINAVANPIKNDSTAIVLDEYAKAIHPNPQPSFNMQ